MTWSHSIQSSFKDMALWTAASFINLSNPASSFLMGAVVALIAVPILKTTFASTGNSLCNYAISKMKVPQGTSSISNQEKIVSNLFFKSVIVGQDFLMTLGSLLMLPALEDPVILLAQPNEKHSFVPVNLNELDQIPCTPQQKKLFQTIKTVLLLSKYIRRDIPYFALSVSCCLGMDLFLKKDSQSLEMVALRLSFLVGTVGVAAITLGVALKAYSLSKQSPTYLAQIEKAHATLIPSSKPVHKVLTTFCTDQRHQSLGALTFLSDDLIRLILHKFPQSDLLRLNLVSRKLHELCPKTDFVQRRIPQPIIDAIGMNVLETLPFFHLNDTLVRAAAPVSDEDWEFQLKRCSHTSLDRDLNGKSLEGIATQQYTIYCKDKHTFSPMTLANGVPSTKRKEMAQGAPLTCFVSAEEMKNQRMMLLVDAAKRVGILFQYQLTYKIKFLKRNAHCTAVLQQIHPEKKEWMWVDMTSPVILFRSNIPYVKYSESLPLNLQSCIRWLYFMQFEGKTLKPDSLRNLEWLKEFSKGNQKKWLIYGQDAPQINAPEVQLCEAIRETFDDRILKLVLKFKMGGFFFDLKKQEEYHEGRSKNL